MNVSEDSCCHDNGGIEIKSGILGTLLMVALVVVSGSLGGMLGERFQRRHGGEYLAESGCVIFGAVGLLLAIWVIGMLAGD